MGAPFTGSSSSILLTTGYGRISLRLNLKDF
uniref:Uncharacterized protein n=1 Tax=Arundo donax TaxID=35708 RepID=A0A0A9GZR9_ARUDO